MLSTLAKRKVDRPNRKRWAPHNKITKRYAHYSPKMAKTIRSILKPRKWAISATFKTYLLLGFLAVSTYSPLVVLLVARATNVMHTTAWIWLLVFLYRMGLWRKRPKSRKQLKLIVTRSRGCKNRVLRDCTVWYADVYVHRCVPTHLIGTGLTP